MECGDVSPLSMCLKMRVMMNLGRDRKTTQHDKVPHGTILYPKFRINNPKGVSSYSPGLRVFQVYAWKKNL